MGKLNLKTVLHTATLNRFFNLKCDCKPKLEWVKCPRCGEPCVKLVLTHKNCVHAEALLPHTDIKYRCGYCGYHLQKTLPIL